MKKIVFLISLIILGLSAQAQMSGAYTIDNTLPTAGTNYASFTAAVSALNIQGVNAAVIFNVAAGQTFNEQISITPVTGASATNSVTFLGNHSTLTNGTGGNYVLQLNDADYIRIKDLEIISTNATNGSAIKILGGSNNNLISGCTATAEPTASAPGDYAVSILASGGLNNVGSDSNIIINCQINNGRTGVYIDGIASDHATHNQVINCEIRDFVNTATWILQSNNCSFIGNEIHRPTRTGITYNGGAITISSQTHSILVSGNHIHSNATAEPTSTIPFYGVIIPFTTSTLPGEEHIIENNLIEGFNSAGDWTGLYSFSSNTIFRHNTVSFESSNSSTATTYGIRMFTNGGSETIQNNSFHIDRGGTGTKYGIYNPNASSVCDYNNFHLSSVAGNSYTGRFGTTNYVTLANWQTANGGAFGQNSTAVNPIFTNVGADDYTPTNPLAITTGASLGVPQDINNIVRPVTSPTIGAFETSCAPLNGNYTIYPNQPPSTTNFLTINQAVNALCRCGVSGPVVFDLLINYCYNEQVEICEVTGASAANSITFNGNNSVLLHSSIATSDYHTLRLNGSDYLRFNNLIVMAGGSTHGVALHLFNAADHNIFDSCSFAASKISTSQTVYGVVINASDSIYFNTTPSNLLPCDSNSIVNCDIVGGFNGVYLRGANINLLASDNSMINSTVHDFYNAGIYVYQGERSIVRDNEIHRLTRINSNISVGGIISSASANSSIEKNHVHDLTNSVTSNTGTGLLAITVEGSLASPPSTKVVNNLIENISTSGNIYGVVAFTGYVQVWHNTVSLNQTANSTGVTFGIYHSNNLNPNVDIRNNNIYITRNTTNTKYGIALYNVTNTLNVNCNHNNVYVTGGGNNATWATSPTNTYNTLATWQTVNGGAWGQNSTIADPIFANPALLDYTPTNSQVLGTGTALGVSDDFNNTFRSNTMPTVGAFEGVACAPLAGTYTINPGLPAGGTNYQTFNAAVNDLCNCGISAPVVFDVVASTTFNEQVSICQVNGTSATNTITFNGNGSTLTHTANAAASCYTLALSGSDYLRFNNLNIVGAGTTFGYGVFMFDAANNNIFDSCNVSVSTSSTNQDCIGILSLPDSTNFSNFLDVLPTCDSNLFSNCIVNGGLEGILFWGTVNNGVNIDYGIYNRFIDCSLDNFHREGIDILWSMTTVVEGCDFTRTTRTNDNGFVGISISGAKGISVEKNYIHHPFISTSSTNNFFGIQLSLISDTLSQNNIVENNLIADIDSWSVQKGINFADCSDLAVRHNTIDLNGNSTTPSNSIADRVVGIECNLLVSNQNVDIENNIVTVSKNSQAPKYALYYLGNTSAIRSDYNNLFVNGGGSGPNYTGRVGANNYVTIANWNTLSGFGGNSSGLDPIYNNIAIVDYTPTNSALIHTGTNLGVTDDFNGNGRPATNPTMGAFEAACSPLAGTYTINPGLPAGGTNYQTFNAAVADLCNCGISAAVTFDVVASTTFNEQVDICEVTGASAANTITFNGNGSTLTHAGTATNSRFTLRLSGSDYLRFNSLNIVGSSTAFAQAVHLYDRANHNIFDSCDISVPHSVGTANVNALAICTQPNTPFLPGNFAACDSNTIINSRISGGYFCVNAIGGNNGPSQGNRIENCSIEDMHWNGLLIRRNNNFVFSNNEIYRPNKTFYGPTFFYLYLAEGTTNGLFEKNHFHSPYAQTPASTNGALGIYCQTQATSGNENNIENNLFEDFNHGSNPIGIFLDNAAYLNITHNTFAINNTHAAADTSYCISSVNTNSEVRIRNNIFNMTGGAGVKVGVRLVNSNFVCDYNDFNLNNTGGVNITGIFGTTIFPTLANWQTANSGAWDQNSTEVDPQFTNPPSNDYTPTNVLIDDTGLPLALIDDFRDTIRDLTTPDVGAFEWNCTQLNGTYTINPALPAALPNFQTFNAAVLQMCNCGITGPVTFNVAPSITFNEQVDICEVIGASAVNTITFNGNNSVLSHTASTSTNRHTLRLSGSDYIRFNNLTFNVGGSVYGHGVHLHNNANNNIFDSCTVQMQSNSTSSTLNGFVISTQPEFLGITGPSAGSDSNLFINNITIGGDKGFAFYGSSTDRPMRNEAINNTIQDFREYGMRCTNTEFTLLDSNNVSRPNRTANFSTFYGIRLGADIKAEVRKNHIHNPYAQDTNFNGISYGLYFAGNVNPGDDNFFVNNLIEDFSSIGGQTGIYLSSSARRTKVWHNTIDLSGNAATAFGSYTYGIRFDGTNGIATSIQNNNITISRTSGSGTFGFRIATGASAAIINNNNVFMNSPANNYYGQFGGPSYITLANWQTANGGTWGQNSTDVDPQYVNPSINDYNPSNLSMDNIGAALGVLDDFENVTRSATAPDPGAFEFACNGLSTIVTNFVSPTDTTISCFGAMDGQVHLSASLGTAPYSYTLLPSTTNSTGSFTGLDTGSYTVYVYDALGCTDTVLFSITQPAVLIIDSITTSNPSCNPGGDGSIVVSVSGGTASYQYNIGGANQASNTFSSLSANTYLVTVTDMNSCIDTMSVTLTTPPVPTITSVVDTNVSCNGANDGSILVTGSSVNTINYTLNPGAVTNTSGYFNNLAPNTYTITLSDALSACTATTTVVISQPNSLNISGVTSSNPSCSPGNDGSLVINASGGTPSYQYNIGGANQTSNTFNGLGANTYLVTVTDSNSCTDTLSVTLITPPNPIITSILDTNITCNGLANGSVAISGSAASAITYTLNPGAISNATGYFNNLAPATYTITLSDASSCTVSTTVNITEPAVLSIDSLTSTLPSCAPGNDGSIIVNVVGGTLPYQYNIGGANQASNSFTSLSSGIYLVTVTDSNLCTDTMSVDLSAPNAPIITSILDTNVTCNGLANGSVAISGSAASAITYTLNPGAISNATGYFNNLTPATYTITLSDASSCTISTTVNITEPAVLNIDSLTSTLPSCAPGNDGSIIVNAVGGTLPYQYNIGGANQSSNSFTSLSSGIYLLTVTDSNLCTDTMSIDLSAPNAPIIASILDTNVTCNGLANGSVAISGSAASAITYTLNPGAISNATGYFNNLAPATYTITLSDASSCTVSTSVVVTEPAVLNIDSLTSTLPSCAPGNDGGIIVNAIGGTLPYQYNIGGANQLSNSFTNLASGIYLVTVTDSNLCTDTISIDLSAPNAPIITSILDTNITCNGLANGSVAISGSAASAITYTLNPGAISNATGYFNNLAPATYTITLSDASSCTISTTVNITEPAVLNIDSLTSSLPSCAPGNDGSIIVNAVGGTLPYQYNIGGANQSSNSFTALASGIYLVTVTDSNLCTDTMSVDLSAPNAPIITSILDTNITCNGLANGSVAISGSAASAITYTLNPGAISNATGNFNNLAPATYTITLSDASSCTVSTSVVVTEPAVLNIDSLTSSLPSCAPGNDGSIIVNAVGGTLPYQYNIGGANQSSNSFTALASGIYLVTVTDSNLCTDTMSVDLSAPNAPIITSILDTNITCNGLANGSVAISGTAASAITYTLNPGAISNATGYFNNLAPATYTITLSDASSCTISTTVNITEPAVLNIDSLTSALPSCAPGNDGGIIVNAIGGTIPYQYNIGGANQSSNSFTNLASGIYLVTVTDSNLCTDTISIDLSAPNAPIITSTLDTNVTCNGLANGSIAISGTAASAITYTLNPGAISNATGYFNNLAPATYTITLSDASSCTVSTSVVITEPAVLNIDSLTSTLPSCAPGNDGSIIVNVVGGTLPYQYNIGGANQASNSFTSLSSGIYLVTVTDSNLCTDTMSVDLSAPNAPIIASILDTNITCNGLANGSVAISGSAASALTYTLNPGAISNATGYFNNLAPATYTITLSDANGCTVSSSVTIAAPNVLSIDSVILTQPSCSPGGDGALVVNTSGGTIPYQYNIGGASQLSNSFNNLGVASYLVTVIDSNNCTDTMTVNLTAPNAPIITSILDTNVSCNGLSDASIQISGTGASAITYTLMPGAISNSTGYFNNLTAIAYTITLSDASNCSVSTTVSITEPNSLTIDSLSLTDPSCIPGNDGIIVVNVNGGTTPYQYNIGGANQVGSSFANLAAATYLVTVTDTNNCTDTMSGTLVAPVNLVVTSVLDTNVSCNGLNDGSLFVQGSGGSNITYTLTPGSISNTVGYFNNLAPNTYTVTLTDPNACSTTTSITITQPASLLIDSIQSTAVLCAGDTNGALSVFSSGGNGGNTYVLNPGSYSNNSGLFTSLAPQVYTITVSDINGCMTTTTDSVIAPAAISATVTTDSVSCFSGNDGEITISASGGVFPYMYVLNPGVLNSTTGIYNNLIAGTYLATVTDSNGCVYSLTNIVVEEPIQLSFASTSTVDITCFGDNNGEINVLAQGGTGAISYGILPNIGTQSAPGQFAQLSAGTYIVTITDANNCTQSQSVTIIENPILEVSSLNITQPSCHGDENGSLTFTVTGGTGGYTYSFDGGLASTVASYSNLSAGSYSLRITDGAGCIRDTILVLTEPAPIRIASWTLESTVCEDSEDGSIAVVATGGNGNFVYYLRPGLAFNSSGVFQNLGSGSYTIEVKDSAGCSFDTTIQIVGPTNPLSVSITKEDLSCTSAGNAGRAEVIVSGGLSPYSFLWSSTPAQTSSIATGLRFGYYFVDVVDANNCLVRDTVYINPGECCSKVFLPNAFSPNGDGRNDAFRVLTAAGVELHQFEIFNRWGQKVWQTYTYDDGWDGTLNGEAQPIGDYYYVYRYNCLTDNKEYIKKGNITLIR